MQRSTETRRPSPSRRAPEATIPKFRELRLSAVVAACAWPREAATPERKRRDSQQGTSFRQLARFEEE